MRAIAFCLRLKLKSLSNVSLLCELEGPEEKVQKLFQQESFLEYLRESKCLVKQAKPGIWHTSLHFFDEIAVIRIRGSKKHLSVQQRHPIVLSTKHDFVSVMIRDLHLENNHEGVQYVRSVFQFFFGFWGYEML